MNSIISTQLDKIKLAQMFCTPLFFEDRNWFPCLPCIRGRLHPINLVLEVLLDYLLLVGSKGSDILIISPPSEPAQLALAKTAPVSIHLCVICYSGMLLSTDQPLNKIKKRQASDKLAIVGVTGFRRLTRSKFLKAAQASVRVSVGLGTANA